MIQHHYILQPRPLCLTRIKKNSLMSDFEFIKKGVVCQEKGGQKNLWKVLFVVFYLTRCMCE
jgi:hypothetical protein